MADKNKKDEYTELNETERVLIYHFLERIQEDGNLRAAVMRDPDVAFAAMVPSIPYSKLLRPNLLHVMGQLRRVALEEIGIDVAPFRDDMQDNGFKLVADNKKA